MIDDCHQNMAAKSPVVGGGGETKPFELRRKWQEREKIVNGTLHLMNEMRNYLPRKINKHFRLGGIKNRDHYPGLNC